MAYALHAYAITKEGKIPVEHIFYGETEGEADKHFRDHVNACPYFGPADREHRMITYVEKVDEIPTPDSAQAEADMAEFEDDGRPER